MTHDHLFWITSRAAGTAALIFASLAVGLGLTMTIRLIRGRGPDGRRSWLQDGRPMHHLLDPATGQPAFTGVVQATAIATTAMEAERRAKAAILSGPSAAPRHLPHGGLLVFEDGLHQLITARADIDTGNTDPTIIGVGAPAR